MQSEVKYPTRFLPTCFPHFQSPPLMTLAPTPSIINRVDLREAAAAAATLTTPPPPPPLGVVELLGTDALEGVKPPEALEVTRGTFDDDEDVEEVPAAFKGAPAGDD